jgi:hypothetical protein
MRGLFCCAAFIAVSMAPAVAQAAPVPFVGCKSDGQVGPQPAPEAPARTPDLPAATASRLAWYGSAYNGVLAPRGWHCFGLYGSNGSFLMVSPEDLGAAPFEARAKGPAVQISVSAGDTSGRFEAAQIAARLFPGRRAFVDRVIAEGILAKSDFPSGAYPHDRIRRQGPDAVAFETPAGEDGMGTKSRLVKSSDPIEGWAAMDGDNDATVLVVRLPAAMRDLAPVIVKAAQDASRP